MSRVETSMTVGSSMLASAFSHIFCCGLLPMAINASASALLGGIGAQIGVAIVTTLLVATGVTYFEKHRHETACAGKGNCSHTGFNIQKHFLRNLCIGTVTYVFFAVLSHLPAVHDVIDHIFDISHS